MRSVRAAPPTARMVVALFRLVAKDKSVALFQYRLPMSSNDLNSTVRCIEPHCFVRHARTRLPIAIPNSKSNAQVTGAAERSERTRQVESAGGLHGADENWSPPCTDLIFNRLINLSRM